VLEFYCPGCKARHPFEVDCEARGWTWNGSMDKPTFSPSLLVHRAEGKGCHSFVTDGMIQFLTDSYHSLAGQTVELPDWDEEKD